MIDLERIEYGKLNSRQKETYNFQKVSAILSDFGFATIKLNDDWQGADFIAQHINGDLFLKVQLKSSLTFNDIYANKDIYICFPDNGNWYLYPHDELRDIFLGINSKTMATTKSWMDNKHYTFGHLSNENKNLLESYRLIKMEETDTVT